jgi:endonuclease G
MLGYWVGRVQEQAANSSQPVSASTHNPLCLGGCVQEQASNNSQPVPASTDNPLCLGGCPTGQSTADQIIAHHILILANNPDTKFADWVAYRIASDTLGRHCARAWHRDPDIQGDATLGPGDFKGVREIQSDRGHQAPLASLCGSQYWPEADFLSNVTPQKTNLNEGPWERLETAERSLVSVGFAQVYSVTGPLFEREMPGLPNAHIPATVPSGYWKVVSVMGQGGAVRVAAFIMDQGTERRADYCSMRVTVGEVERRTHLSLFTKLADADRHAMEAGDSQQILHSAPGTLW